MILNTVSPLRIGPKCEQVGSQLNVGCHFYACKSWVFVSQETTELALID